MNNYVIKFLYMKNCSLPIFLLLIQFLLLDCKFKTGPSTIVNKDEKSNLINTGEMNIVNKVFGHSDTGIPVHSFLLQNVNGMKVEIIEYGAIITRIEIPDKNGNPADIVLGYDDLEGWQNDPYYFGATIGRVANRMGGAQFSLNGDSYDLAPNTLPDFGKNHLHGGVKGFNKVLWSGEEIIGDMEVGVRLEYLSKDGEEGYPGNLNCIVEYTLHEDNSLVISYEATTDKVTVVNFTHHSYFNLSGAGKGNIFSHLIMINADRFTPADDDLIPVGEIAEVKGLPVDFTSERSVGSRFGEMQFEKFKGYDLNYVLNHSIEGALDLAAIVRDTSSGRVMEVYTTQPCMHFYTSNFLSGEPGKSGMPYQQYGALCLEPQGFPDALNHENFKSIQLNPGETYLKEIVYRFRIETK